MDAIISMLPVDEDFDAPALRKGDFVLVNNLKATSKLNGHMARLGNYDGDAGRWEVRFLNDDLQSVRIKVVNLIWIASRMSYDKGAVICKQNYVYSWMLHFEKRYDDLPRIDMQGIAQTLAQKNGIRFEDRTHLLEDFQVNGTKGGMSALQIMFKADSDALNANGKLAILFRRTLLSNACFMFFKAFIGKFDDPDGDQSTPWDYKLVIRDDYCKSERGSELQELNFKSGIATLLDPVRPTCSICLDEIDGHMDNVVLECGHSFHKDCFLDWMESSRIEAGKRNKHGPVPCPNCRSIYSPSAQERVATLTVTKDVADELERELFL